MLQNPTSRVSSFKYGKIHLGVWPPERFFGHPVLSMYLPLLPNICTFSSITSSMTGFSCWIWLVWTLSEAIFVANKAIVFNFDAIADSYCARVSTYENIFLWLRSRRSGINHIESICSDTKMIEIDIKTKWKWNFTS